MSQRKFIKTSYSSFATNGSFGSGTGIYEYEYEYEFRTSFMTSFKESLKGSFSSNVFLSQTDNEKTKVLGYGINLI